MKKITTGLVLVVLACLSAALGAGFAIYLRPAQASRNSAGTMSIPNTFTAGTTISSSSVNANFADIGTELTASLERNGKGGMLAALRGIDGTLAAPALSFTSETGSGLFRNGAGDVRFSLLGSLRQQWTSAGVFLYGGASATKMLVDGTTNAGNFALYAGANGDAPSTTIYNLAGSTVNTVVNAPSGTLSLAVAGAGKASISSSGLTIGASGTAISGSFRGTASLTPANINAQTCANFTAITVTGAATGAECLIGQPAAGANAMSLTCAITATNTCTIQACNPTAGVLTPTAGTYSCRAINP